MLNRLHAGKCEITGLDLDLLPAPAPRGAQHRSNFIPSIDRKQPSLGYTEENCRVVIWGYNAAKSTGTDQDVMRMAMALAGVKATGLETSAALVSGYAGFF